MKPYYAVQKQMAVLPEDDNCMIRVNNIGFSTEHSVHIPTLKKAYSEALELAEELISRGYRPICHYTRFASDIAIASYELHQRNVVFFWRRNVLKDKYIDFHLTEISRISIVEI